MNNGGVMDKEGLAKLSLLERATLKDGLRYDDYLSIAQITALLCPIYPASKDKDKQRAGRDNRKIIQASKESYQREIIKACQNGLIAYQGNIDGWTEYANPKKIISEPRFIPFKRSDDNWINYEGDWLPPTNSETDTPKKYYPADCTIHRNEFKRYWQLPNENPRPINSLLASWFGDDGIQHIIENRPVQTMACGLGKLIDDNIEVSKALPIEQWAKIAVVWPDEFSIKDIAKLAYPDDKELQEALIDSLVKLCKGNKLNYYGDIDGWTYKESKPNPYPKIKLESAHCGVVDLFSDNSLSFFCADACLIHRDDFKFFLQSQNQWPIGGLLANWWRNDELSAKQKIGKIKPNKSDQLRAEHVKEWVKRTQYTGRKSDKQINAALKAEKPDLWGDTMDTFRKWLQSEEAAQVKALLPNTRRKQPNT